MVLIVLGLAGTSWAAPPVIHSLTADPSQVYPDLESQLSCDASDPEGDALSFSWTSDLGVVTAGEDGAAIFTSTDAGLATVTCTVADPDGEFATAEVRIVVSSVIAERSLREGLRAPQKVSVDSMGDLYTADRAAGGINVVHLFTETLVYRLPIADVRSVAVDWQDDLLVGGDSGARIIDRTGSLLLTLDPLEPLGPVADVAVDFIHHRYAALHHATGRVVIYDELGTVIASFASTGDGPGELRSPQGAAFTPSGDLVVADSGHGLIKKFDPTGNLIISFGGPGPGAGHFVQPADVAVGPNGDIYASDAYQDWVQIFDAAGTLREVIGTYGEASGQFKTATGVSTAGVFDRLIVTSTNGPSLEVFKFDGGPPPPDPLPLPVLSSNSLDFGDLPVGSISDPVPVTLSNVGGAPLGIRHVIVDGDFARTDTCESFLDPGQSCSFFIQFAPTVPGARAGSLQIDTSAQNGFLAVDLLGVGVVPPEIIELTSEPSALYFGQVPVGGLSEPLSVMIINTGTVTTTIASVALTGANPGDFLLDLDMCTGAVLEVDQHCELAAVFAPTVDGERHAEIAIQTTSGPIFAVELTGGGDQIFSDGFETGDSSRWSDSMPPLSNTIGPLSLDFGCLQPGVAMASLKNRSEHVSEDHS